MEGIEKDANSSSSSWGIRSITRSVVQKKLFVVRFPHRVRLRSSLALFSTSLFNCSISSSIFFGKLVASAIQFTVSVANLSRTVSVSALPRRNASSGPSVVVSARAFVPDDDDSGLDAFASFWTKRLLRVVVFPRVPVVAARRTGRRRCAGETEDERGGPPGETMGISRRSFVLHFFFFFFFVSVWI